MMLRLADTVMIGMHEHEIMAREDRSNTGWRHRTRPPICGPSWTLGSQYARPLHCDRHDNTCNAW